MTRSDVARLFAYCCLYDSRLEADELKILAWHEALMEAISFEWAKVYVAKFYGASKYSIAPADFNLEFDRERKVREEKTKSRQLEEEWEESRRNRATPESIRAIREMYPLPRKGQANDDTTE
jgi:hypothetical protein